MQLVGIVEEQHPARARLFMQWQRLPWPVAVDALGLFGVEVVPIVVAIDEAGIIRHVNLTVEELRSRFLAQPAPPTRPAAPPPLAAIPSTPASGAGAPASAWRDYADGLFLWGGSDRLDEAVAAYEEAARLEPRNATTQFHLGTTLRRRYDIAPANHEQDFRRAIEAWSRALELNPNNYIWRRRLQQYGPRLTKPYPFYDWVERARLEIRARGETPAPLDVEPAGAELAVPGAATAPAPAGREPDPRARIHTDEEALVRVAVAAVPPGVRAGESVRVHVELTPDSRRQAHWNNEGGGLVFWVKPPAGWQLDRQRHVVTGPKAAVSEEIRRIDFELSVPPGTPPGSVRVEGYALYYVCEGESGTCLYRRRNVSIPIIVR